MVVPLRRALQPNELSGVTERYPRESRRVIVYKKPPASPSSPSAPTSVIVSDDPPESRPTAR